MRPRFPRLKFHRDRPIEPGENVYEELEMGLDVARIEPTSFTTAPQGAARRSRTATPAGVEDSFTRSTGDVPAAPPPEVLEAMDAAGRVARELHETGRELRFTPPHPGDAGRVRVEVRDLDGNVLRTIPPSELLDVATGAPLD